MYALAAKERTLNKVLLLDIDLIDPNPAQPREIFQQSEIESLATSICENGLLQPLTVRRNKGRYELISGERRLRALKYAQMKEAPAIIMEASDRQSAILALMENIQRADLNYFEEALALKNLMVEWGISQQELGARLGKAQPTIANKLRLLKFEEPMRKLMIDYGINERQARALLHIEDNELLKQALNQIGARQMNVAQTEEYIKKLVENKEKPKKKFHPIIKDVRLFFNTVNHAVSVMNQSGIHASAMKVEKGDYIEYIVRIPIVN